MRSGCRATLRHASSRSRSAASARGCRALASASIAATMAAEQFARLGPRGTGTRRCYARLGPFTSGAAPSPRLRRCGYGRRLRGPSCLLHEPPDACSEGDDAEQDISDDRQGQGKPGGGAEHDDHEGQRGQAAATGAARDDPGDLAVRSGDDGGDAGHSSRSVTSVSF